MIAVSQMAVDKLKEVIREEGGDGSALRIGVVPGHNGGAQYMLSLEEAPAEGDVLIDDYEVPIVMDRDTVPLVEGAEIDYVEDLMRSGFVISNPNLPAGAGCGCGGNCACGGH